MKKSFWQLYNMINEVELPTYQGGSSWMMSWGSLLGDNISSSEEIHKIFKLGIEMVLMDIEYVIPNVRDDIYIRTTESNGTINRINILRLFQTCISGIRRYLDTDSYGNLHLIYLQNVDILEGLYHIHYRQNMAVIDSDDNEIEDYGREVGLLANSIQYLFRSTEAMQTYPANNFIDVLYNSYYFVVLTEETLPYSWQVINNGMRMAVVHRPQININRNLPSVLSDICNRSELFNFDEIREVLLYSDELDLQLLRPVSGHHNRYDLLLSNLNPMVYRSFSGTLDEIAQFIYNNSLLNRKLKELICGT